MDMIREREDVCGEMFLSQLHFSLSQLLLLHVHPRPFPLLLNLSFGRHPDQTPPNDRGFAGKTYQQRRLWGRPNDPIRNEVRWTCERDERGGEDGGFVLWAMMTL